MTISGQFLISIPIESKNGCEEDEVECVSGETLSFVEDRAGCEVNNRNQNRLYLKILILPFPMNSQVSTQNETYVICACTHLTAFSALFLPTNNCDQVFLLFLIKFELLVKLIT